LGDSVTQEAEIPNGLIRKAKGFLGRAAARQEILQLMDNSLRVQAAEAAARLVNPADLYTVGQQAVVEAIKLYKFTQAESFREFATAFARQSMVLARTKAAPQKPSSRPPPLRSESLGKNSPPPKTPAEE